MTGIDTLQALSPMSTLSRFLEDLFQTGKVVFRDSMDSPESERPRVVNCLSQAFEEACLELAGPPLIFEETAAIVAAEWTRRACWFLVHRTEPEKVLNQALKLPNQPKSPGEHFSADLTFRYLPLVYRRSRALSPEDPLTIRLMELLRSWPLSGVLSDVEEAPIGPVDWTWGGSPGLMLLYAERLASTEKPAWRPSGLALEYVELVLEGLGKQRSPLLQSPNKEFHLVDKGHS